MREVALAGVLALCACATAPAGSSRAFAEGAMSGGANPGFNPTTDAYNLNFDGPGSSNGPVFIIPWRQGAAATAQEQEAERQRYIAMYKAYWMAHPERYAEHHLFPRAFRARFQIWNWEWRQWLNSEGATAELPDLWKKAFEMIDKYGLGPHGPLSPYKCGREVVHDQFDVLDKPPTNK
jgi:hypothetical protein